MDQDKIGKLIAKLRKSKKLTQEQLGAKLGVNSKAVSKWECGLTTPDISIVNELAHILGITTTELLDGKQTTDINQKTYFAKEDGWKTTISNAFCIPSSPSFCSSSFSVFCRSFSEI